MGHMSAAELATIDKMRREGKEVSAILRKLQADRLKKEGTGPSESALYRYLSGEVYVRGAADERGRPDALPKNLVKVACKERLKLAKLGLPVRVDE